MLSVTLNSFGYDKDEVLRDVSFRLEKGQHLVILGESGCGKSTLLHLIYGLLDLENGTLFWNDQQLKGPKHNLIPGESFIKLVAQEFNVMPFISVAENIATYLPRMDQKADAIRVQELLEVVDLQEFANTHVKNLSGGQKQRVALAKALAETPELLLLDEPFGHIDTFRKNSLRRRLFSYLKANDIACITATHDSEEALSYADTIVILRNGTIAAQGTPEHIYNEISSLYHGSFFGEVSTIPSSLLGLGNAAEEILLFPHQLRISDQKTPLGVRVIQSYFKGSHYLVQSYWKGGEVFFVSSEKLPAERRVYLTKYE